MIRITAAMRPQLRAFLSQDVPTNLYLLSVLYRAEHGGDAEDLGQFYGLFSDDELRAVLYFTFGGLLVTYAPDPDHAWKLGNSVRGHVVARMLVGPREATDALWGGLRAPFKPRLYRDHQLYSLQSDQLVDSFQADVRRAQAKDLEPAFESAALMQSEELGIDFREIDLNRFRQRVAGLIADEAFFVLESGDRFAFQAAVSTRCPEGAQVEAVYTPEDLRGQGFAYRGLTGMCKTLFAQYPLLTLHVHEENQPAIGLYKNLGFQSYAPFRLISC